MPTVLKSRLAPLRWGLWVTGSWSLVMMLFYLLAPGLMTAQTRKAPVTLSISADIFRQAALLYREFDTEFLGCLYGETVGLGQYRVTLMVLGAMKPSKSYRGGIQEGIVCPLLPYDKLQLLGTIHNHPVGLCIASDVDMETFLGSELPIHMLMCSEHQLQAWTLDGWFPICRFDPETEFPQCVTTTAPKAPGDP